MELAGTFTALCVLCERLRRAPGALRTLGLRLAVDGHGEGGGGGLYAQLLRQGAEVASPRSHAAWHRLLRLVGELAQVRATLLPPHQPLLVGGVHSRVTIPQRASRRQHAEHPKQAPGLTLRSCVCARVCVWLRRRAAT